MTKEELLQELQKDWDENTDEWITKGFGQM